MSIQNEIDRIKTNVTEAYSAVEERGGTVPEEATVANLAGAVRTIPEGTAGANGTLFIVNHDEVPQPDDYFNITPDRIYGATPSNDDAATLIAFTPDGIFDCGCVVTDYTPGKWATQIKVTTVDGINVYSKEKVDQLIDESSFITFKNTYITNISQLPVDEFPCCLRMVQSDLGFCFKNDIIYVTYIGGAVSVFTMDGMIGTLLVDPEDGTLTLDEVMLGNKGDPGASAYEIAVQKGFEGTEEQWLESLKGSDGFSPTVDVEEIDGGHQVMITDVNGSQSFNVMDGLVSGSIPVKPITSEVYEALTEEEKNADVVWLLTNADGGST